MLRAARVPLWSVAGCVYIPLCVVSACVQGRIACANGCYGSPIGACTSVCVSGLGTTRRLCLPTSSKAGLGGLIARLSVVDLWCRVKFALLSDHYTLHIKVPVNGLPTYSKV